MFNEMMPMAFVGGGNYALTEWSAVYNAAQIYTIPTIARAKAIFLLNYYTVNGQANCYTNVNPTTGEIDEEHTWRANVVTTGTPTVWTQSAIKFIVTDNSITTSDYVTGNNSRYICFYTY